MPRSADDLAVSSSGVGLDEARRETAHSELWVVENRLQEGDVRRDAADPELGNPLGEHGPLPSGSHGPGT